MIRPNIISNLLLMGLLSPGLMISPLQAQTGDNPDLISQERNSITQTESSNLAAEDRQFIAAAALVGMAEIEMARLAQRKSSSERIKQFAQHMIDDHTDAHNELTQVASSRGVTLPVLPAAEDREMIDRMQELDGAAFDRMYIEQAGLKAHTRMEELFQKAALESNDSDLKTFAAAMLPVIRQHLQVAREMGGKVRTNAPG